MAYQLLRFPHTTSISFLLTSFLLLTIVHLAKQQISISGACKARCDRQRTYLTPYAFKFTCQNPETCTPDCESCPKQVCDETTGPDSYRNWHCPAIDFKISDECNNYCNQFRSKGSPGGTQIFCNSLQHQGDRYECKSQCEKCSKFFCDSENNDHVLYCPWDIFDGNCKLECDKTRVRDLDSEFTSHVGKFKFRCSDFYTGNEEQLCQDTLRNECPAYVQDEDDIDIYYCPSVTEADLSGECKAFCNNHTKDEAEIVNCYKTFLFNDPPDDSATAIRKCGNICSSCATSQGINYVCDPGSPMLFHCPRDAPIPLDPLPLIKRSYKGPCKHRCDVSQGGGPQAFSIYCNKFYETPEERKRCVQVCTEECLEEDCRHYGKEDGIIFCKGDEQKVKQLRKEEDRKNEQRRELNDQLFRHEHAIDELITVFVVIGILLVILIIAFFCSCWCNRKKMKRLDQQQLAQLGQIGPAGQASGQMATNPSVGLMSLKGQGPRQPSRTFSTGPSPIGGQQPMQVGSGVQGQGQMLPPTVGMWESK